MTAPTLPALVSKCCRARVVWRHPRNAIMLHDHTPVYVQVCWKCGKLCDAETVTA